MYSKPLRGYSSAESSLEPEAGAAVALGGPANAGASVLGRGVSRTGDLPPLLVTVNSMGIGSSLLLAGGLVTQGLPPLPLRAWAIIAWLAAVNTVFAFTLWNKTLQTLSAAESSVINNTIMIQIPILAVLFLGERVPLLQALGLLLARDAAGAAPARS